MLINCRIDIPLTVVKTVKYNLFQIKDNYLINLKFSPE